MRRLPKIERENASHANYVLANSYFSREAILRALGINASVCYLGIDTRLFRPLALTRENFVLSVGMCEGHKGFDFLLRALGLINESARPRLLIAANRTSRDWEAYLQKLAARLDVKLEIKRAVSDQELVVLYNQATVFVYGPILEPFGLAPLEAMACGTPVVAVKEGGVRETVVHGETGILTDRDEQAFAEAVAEMLRDEILRKRLGDQALESVKSFWTCEQAGERLVGHLERVAGGRQQGARA
jgi:glycosyltransferase involved in cell wall biosynthesis